MATINHGDQETTGNPDYFTGQPFVTTLSEPEDPNGVRVVSVRFPPTVHSNWHSHEGGQVLHVLSGKGVVVNSGGQRLAMHTGDTVTVPPGELHWHGATADSELIQMSITSNGLTLWAQKVDDDDYSEAVAEG